METTLPQYSIAYQKPPFLQSLAPIVAPAIVQINTDGLSGDPFPQSLSNETPPYDELRTINIQVIIKRRSLGYLLACFFLLRTRKASLALPYEDGTTTYRSFRCLHTFERISLLTHGAALAVVSTVSFVGRAFFPVDIVSAGEADEFSGLVSCARFPSSFVAL